MLDCIFINHLNNFQSFVLICRVKHVKMHMHINLEYCFRKDFIPLCSIVTMVCRLSVTALEIPFTMQKKINENFFIMEILIRSDLD